MTAKFFDQKARQSVESKSGTGIAALLYSFLLKPSE